MEALVYYDSAVGEQPEELEQEAELGLQSKPVQGLENYILCIGNKIQHSREKLGSLGAVFSHQKSQLLPHLINLTHRLVSE